MCEAELWEEALIELKRQSYAQAVHKQAPAWRAQIYLGMERYQEVLALQKEAVRADCPIDSYLAVAYARLGNMQSARRIAEEALRLKQSGAKIAMGDVYFAEKQYDAALIWYEAAAQHRTQRVAAQRAIGRALIALGDYREARVMYEQAIRKTAFVLPEDLLQLARCLQGTDPQYAAELEILASEKA